MSMLTGEFWWKNITGPRMVISGVTGTLRDGRMAVLEVPDGLPWPYIMRDTARNAFGDITGSGDTVFEMLEAGYDIPSGEDPGRFILSRYATADVGRGYREKSKVTIQEYIKAKNVLRNRIIWIYGLDRSDAGRWLAFCRGFGKSSPRDGLIVLEMREGARPPEAKNAAVISYRGCVSRHDVLLFNSFVLEEKPRTGSLWKQYIAAVSASLCGTDAELSEELMEGTDFRDASPLDVLKEIASGGRRGTEAMGHPLWLCLNGGEETLRHRLWEAQLQVLFPLIELEKTDIVKEWKEEIGRALTENCIMQYGERVCSAQDAELGTLCYMMGKRNEDGLYFLYIPDEEARERISFLHECRNTLAHACTCTPQMVARLLDQSPER